MIDFRVAMREDIPTMMEFVRSAQEWFRLSGIDQWQDGYPTAAVFEEDIARGRSYVMESDGRVVATMCLSFDGEPTYSEIDEGEWLDDAPYAVVHRVVVDFSLRGRGLAQSLFQFAIKESLARGIKSIRVDTHKDNRPMQRLLEKLKFLHCGRIVLESGADREAYQLQL